MTPSRRNFLVGLVVLIGALVLVGMSLQFANKSFGALFSKGTPFTIYSDRVDGVSEGSPIYYLGVSVGRVMRVRRVAGEQRVIVEATLDPGPPLPENVVGVIRPQSALGMSALISLELNGRPMGNLNGNSKPIDATFSGGGIVPPEFGLLARDLREQQLIRHLDETVISMRLQLEKAGKTFESVNGLLVDQKSGEDVRSIIANVRSASANLERFTAGLDALSKESTATLVEVRGTVTDGHKGINDLSKQLDTRMAQLGDVLEKANAVATKIDKGQGTAGALVNDPRLYESLVDTSKELGETVKEMKLLVRQWTDEGLHLKVR